MCIKIYNKTIKLNINNVYFAKAYCATQNKAARRRDTAYGQTETATRWRERKLFPFVAINQQKRKNKVPRTKNK